MLDPNKAIYMPDMYKDVVEKGKDKIFAIYQRIDGSRREFSYNYVAEQAKNLSAKLKKAGLKKGDRIGVVSSLRPAWFALHYVALQDGYIMVCMDPGVPALQMQKMMVDTDVRAVFSSIKGVHLPKELENHIPVYAVDDDFELLSKCNKVDSILLGDAEPMLEDTFYVLFSSGTTSANRKAVLLSHKTITKSIDYCMDIPVGKKYASIDRDLMLFPPYHIAGLFSIGFDFYNGTKIIMLERLTPNALVSVMQNLKPQNICTVPSMLTSLYKKIVNNYSSNPLTKNTVNTLLSINGFLRKNLNINIGPLVFKKINKQAFGGELNTFMIGASPIDEPTNKFFLNMGINVCMNYGLTELGAPIMTTHLGYYPQTVGKILYETEGFDVRVVNKDETGRGEVEVLSPLRMLSYMNPKDNEGCFTEDGYFKTGDLGYYDKNNCLVICGRIKESIVLRNGEKLLPEEIESKYLDLDCVDQVVAFKVPGAGGCDDFAIALTKEKDKGIPDEATKTRVYERAEHLPQMYRPKDVYVLKEFPLSSSHKVQRFRLTEMVEKGMNEPITDASMIPVDDDETTASLRKILIEVGGVEWKTKKLTQGLLLNLDSLATVDLYVAIQEKWNIDLFQTSNQPETFGELLDIIKNFDVLDKNNKLELDLSKYPLPVSKVRQFASSQLEKIVKQMWHVKGYGTYGIDTKQNYLFCSNHRTVLDPAFISSCLPKKIQKNTCIVGKAELVNDKLLKTFVLSHNLIPIDRTGNSIQTLDRCRELLNEGWNVLIFPEGTNVENNTKMYPLKDGAAKLAIATGKQIIPVHITGVAHMDKEMSDFALPKLRSRIRIKFGKPISPENMTVTELNEVIREKIEELN